MRNNSSIANYLLYKAVTVWLLTCLFSGCATIISGTEQDVQFGPAGSKLEIYAWDGTRIAKADGAKSANKIAVHRPEKGQSYLVKLSKSGQCPQYWLTSHSVNPVAYGNILLGGLVGLAVDGSNGSGLNIKPADFYLNEGETKQCSR